MKYRINNKKNMRMLTTSAMLTLAMLFTLPVFSQIAIGEWRDHLPYNRAISVADAGQKIYCATEFSLFYFDRNDQSINRMSKVNGLSDIGISAIAYSNEYNTLLIAYTNTNIDLVKDGNIINISDIKRKQILGKKTINGIYFADSLAYLACGFGIVVLDIKNEEFPEPTYFIGAEASHVDVKDITIGKDTIYTATEIGIFKAAINSPNLADFNEWSVDQRILPNRNFNAIAYFSDMLIANYHQEAYSGDTVFRYDYSTNQWERFPEIDLTKKYNIHPSHDKLIIAGQTKVYFYNQDYSLNSAIYNLNGGAINARNATLDENGTKWIADFTYGLMKTDDNFGADIIIPNGPYASNVFDMSLENEQLWVASGGRNSGWGKIYLTDGVYSFVDESWESYNRAAGYSAYDSISDMVCVAVDPNRANHAFVGTWMEGVMEFLDGEIINIYNETNSSLEIWPAGDYVAVSGVALDRQNNLWVVNSGAPNLLSVMKPGGEWRSFPLTSSLSGADAGKLVIDSYGQKWITVRADNKLVVFTDNNTIDDPTDDVTKILTNATGNGSLPGNRIMCVAQDIDEEMWIGSDEGIAVIYSPGNIFTSNNYDAQRILVEVGGYTQYLLESEIVTAIAIDGKNRKWIGTERSGVFLLSPDGTNEILHFTEENSPLYSNYIADIEINDENGEVFFGTDKGILSYKSTATKGKPNNNDVLVYPNPVREGYQGKIAIKGLVVGANVKITDVSGTLIYATTAGEYEENEPGGNEGNGKYGGQAIWNGHSFDGRKASTGVYLVFATDDEGNEKVVAKILFIN